MWPFQVAAPCALPTSSSSTRPHRAMAEEWSRWTWRADAGSGWPSSSHEGVWQEGGWGGKGCKGLYPSAYAGEAEGGGKGCKGLSPSTAPPGMDYYHHYPPTAHTAPLPPGATHLAEAFNKGHGKGYNEGLSEGYVNGHARGFQDGLAAKRGRDEEEDWSWVSSGSAAAGKKNKKKGGDKWKAWREMYTEANMETEEPIFKCRLGPKSVECYPEEVQKELRELWKGIHQNGMPSQEYEYDMGDDYVYTIRLFAADELDQWEGHLAKHSETNIAGAQWDKSKAKNQPPIRFDSDVTYRPIFLHDRDA